jgi:hypothetical protein
MLFQSQAKPWANWFYYWKLIVLVNWDFSLEQGDFGIEWYGDNWKNEKRGRSLGWNQFIKFNESQENDYWKKKNIKLCKK